MGILNDVAARLSEKIAASARSVRCGRIDLTLGDYKMIGEHGAELLVQYGPELGEPNSNQLGEWVAASFNDTLRLVPASIRVYPEEGGITLRVQRDVPKIPVKYKESMVHTGGARYADTNHAVWDVKTDDSGSPYLERVATDDIEAMLQERLSRQRAGRYAHARPRLEILKEAGGVASLDTGDRVLFLDNGLQQFGEIVSVGAENVKIKVKNETLSVNRKEVVDVVEKSPAAIKKEDKELAKFWRQIYGPDFPVEDLARK